MKPVAIGVGALTAVVVLLLVGWILGAGGAVMRLLPNGCDPGNQRLSVIESDPVASLQVSGARVIRKFSTPAGGTSRCDDATVEIDLASSDQPTTYRAARQQIETAGWKLSPNATLTGPLPTAYYVKRFSGWDGILTVGGLSGSTDIVVVFQAPPIHENAG